jgi:hypothetical protein
MQRKQITKGIWLIAIAVVAVLILSPSGKVLVIGGLPIVTPVAVLLEAIGITMIITAGASGWTKRMAIIGAILGTMGMGITAIAENLYKTEAEYLVIGAITATFGLLFMALGKAIDQWKNNGFHAIRFRAIGSLIGTGLGIFLLVRNPPVSFSDFLNAFSVIIFIGLFGLLFGWLVDYIVLSGRKLFNSIYRCEIMVWLAFALLVGVVAVIFPKLFQNLFLMLNYGSVGQEVVFLAPLFLFIMLYLPYLFYLFLWQLKKPWNWILIFVAGGYFILGFSFLAIGDAFRRISALLYTGDKPVRFAFGGIMLEDSLKNKKLLIKAIVIALILLAVYAGVLSFLYYIGTTYTPPVS